MRLGPLHSPAGLFPRLLLQALLFLPIATPAIALEDGAIVVVSEDEIYQVDPATGSQTTLMANPFGYSARGMDIGVDGKIYMVHGGSVSRVDPVTGATTLLSSGGLISKPTDIVVDPEGNIFVLCSPPYYEGPNQIVRIDGATGEQGLVITDRQVPSYDPDRDPARFGGIALDRNGMLILTQIYESWLMVVSEIDPAAGAAVDLYSIWDDYVGHGSVEVAGSGFTWIDLGDAVLARFAPVSNARRNYYMNEVDDRFALDLLGRPILLASYWMFENGQGEVVTGAIVRIHPASGNRTILSETGKIPRSFMIAVAPLLDTDGDGVPNRQDNCLVIPNPGQRDDDADGYGNRCDADLNNNCLVGENDVDILLSSWGDTSGTSPADINEDGVVGGGDLARLGGAIGAAPGPSGLASAVCDPSSLAGDADDDGVANGTDNCPDNSNADQRDSECIVVAGSGECITYGRFCYMTSGTGTCQVASDGVGDVCDVCVEAVNPGQRDDDGDGHGNRCDTDFDNDCDTDQDDFDLLIAHWLTSGNMYDVNEDGVVGGADLGMAGAAAGTTPGPSGHWLDAVCSP